MAKYRSKAIEVEAVRFGIETQLPEWFVQSVEKRVILLFSNGAGYVKTLEGVIRVETGDYVICENGGEIYSCKPQMFKKFYEEIV